MRKNVLLMLLVMVANTLFAQGPFTEGNLVLYRHNIGGSGGNKDPNNNGNQAIQIFLDEYKMSADGNSLEFVQTVPLPIAADGTNNPVTCVGWTAAEGYMTRSYDGRYLIIPGYGVTPGTVAASQSSISVPRVVARIDYQANINSTLKLTNIFSGVNYRAATSYDGVDVWLSGAATSADYRGPYYASIGQSGNDAINLGTAIQGSQCIKIFDNQLYTTVSTRLYQIGTGLPKSTINNSSYKAVTPIYTAQNPLSLSGAVDFYMADLSGGKVLYISTTTASSAGNGGFAAGIHKWSLVGDDWVYNGGWANANGVKELRSLEGKVETGKVKLFAVSHTSNPDNGDSKVYLFKDDNGYNEPISILGGTPKLLLDITGQNKQFRSIAWAPVENSVLPVKLSSFEAKSQHNHVQLNWKTSSESNNSHFEILRSDGTEFKVIGIEKGAGNSSEEKSYNFIDRNPLSGMSYYQLRQVDFDNKSEFSKIIPVSITPKQTELKVYNGNSGELVIDMYTAKAGKAIVEITDAIGRKVLTQQIEVKSGYNIFGSQLTLGSGIYVASLFFDNGTTSIKFIK